MLLFYVLTAIGEEIILRVLQGKKYASVLGLRMIPCDLRLYEPITFLVGGYWFTI